MDIQLFLLDLERKIIGLGEIVRQGNRDLYNTAGVGERTKGDGTIVTDVDDKINFELLDFARRKGVGYVGEEGDGETSKKFVLNVDELDGTEDFASGGNSSTIIATLMEMNGEFGTPILTVMHEPITRRTWTAIAGCSTHFNGIALPDLSTLSVVSPRIKAQIFSFPGDAYRLDKVSAHIFAGDIFTRRQGDAVGINAGLICCGLRDLVAFSATAAVEAPSMQLLVEGVGGVAVNLNIEPLGSYEFGEMRGKPNFMLPNGAIFAANQFQIDELDRAIKHVNLSD